MGLLEELIDNWKEPDRRLMRRVAGFLKHEQSISSRSMTFTKLLSEVAHRIYSLDPELLDDRSDKVYLFNMEAVASIDNALELETNEDEIKKLTFDKFHYFSRAAKAAEYIFRKTGDITWAGKWHEANMVSGSISTELNTMHSGNSFYIAGEAAKETYNIISPRDYVSLEEKLSWAEKAFSAYTLSAESFRKFKDYEKAAFSYASAGEITELVSELINPDPEVSRELKENWCEKGYNSYRTSAEISRQANHRHSFHAESLAGNRAHDIYNITGSLSWARKWHEHCRISSEMAQEINPETEDEYDLRHAAFCMKISAEAARIMFKKTRQRKWGKKALRCYGISGKLFERHLISGTDPRAEDEKKKVYDNIEFVKSRLMKR